MADQTPQGADGTAPKTIAPFGAWRSPFSIERMVQAGDVMAATEVVARDGVLWWIERRAEEAGRQALMRRARDGTIERLTPPGFNARTRVHEYGGGAIAIGRDSHGDEVVLVSDFATGRLCRVSAPGAVEPLTPERRWRYADGVVDALRGRVVVVREDHDPTTIERHGEAENALVAVDLASGDVSVLADGADFYAAPRLSPDGMTLSWLEWRHPNMPWDGTELRVALVLGDGTLGDARTVAGSATEWISEPRWSPDGVLHFLAEDTGWLSLYRVRDGRIEPVALLDAEIGKPDWLFGNSRYAFLGDGSVVFAARSGGRDRLYRIGSGDDPRRPQVIETPYADITAVVSDGRVVVIRGATRDRPGALVEVDPASGATRLLHPADQGPSDAEDLSPARLVEFPTTRGRTAFGMFYPPFNRSFDGPPGQLPPLVVTSHGGPTSSASLGFFMFPHILASRGFAVLDVDYGGSTGYGREYRRRLEGEWGVVDVEDCVAGARWLAEQGLVDGERLAIRGSSASGYTTLCALAFTDAFDAGVSRFGLGDLETFRAQTHKFESRYLERLIGPYEAERDRYHDRSPLNFADRISCPVLVLQGLEDRVVPPEQAEQIVAALRDGGIPHAYVTFPGEDHGFRSAEAVRGAIGAELWFYGRVFGFEPADELDPVEVVFLDARPSPTR